MRRDGGRMGGTEMSMSLYHIDRELENLIDQETGEVLDFDAFEALQMARDAKIEGVLCWTKNLAAEAKAIREEEKELAERRKELERKREKLLDYAEKALGGAAFQTAKCAVTYRKSTAVEITDMDAVVQWCMDNGYDGKITYAQPTVSKTDIAPLLKSGMAVTGAELCERSNMGVK